MHYFYQATLFWHTELRILVWFEISHETSGIMFSLRILFSLSLLLCFPIYANYGKRWFNLCRVPLAIINPS